MNRKIYEEAYLEILECIYSGSRPDLPKGASKADIAVVIEMEGNPVEVEAALDKLVEHAILVLKDGKYDLTVLEDPDIRRYLELREVLETYFVRRLVRRWKEPGNQNLLDELNDAAEQTKSAVENADRPGFRAACRKFHKDLTAAAAYPLAGDFIESLWEFAWMLYHKQHADPVPTEHMEQIQKEHEAILEAIKDRKESKAVKAIRKHYREIRRRAEVKHRWSWKRREVHDQLAVGIVVALVGGSVPSIALGELVVAFGALVLAAVGAFLVSLR